MKKKTQFYRGKKVRLVHDMTGELPVRYMGRAGVVVGPRGSEDGTPIFAVRFPGRTSPLILFEDELKVI